LNGTLKPNNDQLVLQQAFINEPHLKSLQISTLNTITCQENFQDFHSLYRKTIFLKQL